MRLIFYFLLLTVMTFSVVASELSVGTYQGEILREASESDEICRIKVTKVTEQGIEVMFAGEISKLVKVINYRGEVEYRWDDESDTYSIESIFEYTDGMAYRTFTGGWECISLKRAKKTHPPVKRSLNFN